MLNPQEVTTQITRKQGELHVGPSSIDLHIADEKTRLVEEWKARRSNSNFIEAANFGGVLEVDNETSYPVEQTIKCDPVRVEPGEFCLARSQEELDLDPNIAAEVNGRSSVGRLGLFVENAGLVDRGFEGTITLELFNPTNRVIEVPAETRVAQLTFYEQQGHPQNAYDGKYNGQVAPTGSRLHADEDL